MRYIFLLLADLLSKSQRKTKELRLESCRRDTESVDDKAYFPSYKLGKSEQRRCFRCRLVFTLDFKVLNNCICFL